MDENQTLYRLKELELLEKIWNLLEKLSWGKRGGQGVSPASR
jgi:hypothetical protein